MGYRADAGRDGQVVKTLCIGLMTVGKNSEERIEDALPSMQPIRHFLSSNDASRARPMIAKC